eukprot:5919747-Amphidinium_carterae.1
MVRFASPPLVQSQIARLWRLIPPLLLHRVRTTPWKPSHAWAHVLVAIQMRLVQSAMEQGNSCGESAPTRHIKLSDS